MQEQGVVQPSKSPWASPVVLVKKRDGTHKFCVDYRGLNAVTKPDSFPLPRIEDMLDVLGKAKYFSSIDLASGFWQIRMHPKSQEKTAFITPHGLYEFREMPFGLTNAPAIFQRLMQQVITSLNSESEPEFVSVYIDDILVFSKTLEEHLLHIQRVIERIVQVGLKLKPTKCRFVQKELEYLGHIVSRDGLKPNPRLVEAVEGYPEPTSVQETRRFLGLCSYYRKFVPQFARIANPLHHLTRQDVVFQWTPECHTAYEELKRRLVSAPILAHPNFEMDFILETDASVHGLGAILSQVQLDGKPHPVSYASRAVNDSEWKYGITELETLAVVWGVSHFHHFLYGHNVTIYTDHTAVRAVLEAENPTAKHARWWTRVYGRGVKSIKIQYRAGRENSNADALSRSPYLPAPAVGIAENEVQVSTIAAEDAGPTCEQQGFQPSMRQNQGLPGENAAPQEQVALGRCTELGVGPKTTIPLEQQQQEAVLLAELPFPSIGDDGDPTTGEEAAGISGSEVSPYQRNPKGNTPTELSTPALSQQAILRHRTTPRGVVAPLQQTSATHTGGGGLDHQAKLAASDEEYQPTMPESGQAKRPAPVVSELQSTQLLEANSSANETQTATHSATSRLEHQTAPHAAKETQTATHSATSRLEHQTVPHAAKETQTATHSATSGLEHQTVPHAAKETQTATHSATSGLEHQTVPHAAQEDGTSVSAGERASVDCYLEYAPQVHGQVQPPRDGGNTRPQRVTQGTAPGSPSVPAVLAIEADDTHADVPALLQRPVARGEHNSHQTMITEQAKDPELKQLITFVSHGVLPLEETIARKMALQRSLFTIVEGVLYYVDPKRDNRKRAVVPKSLQKRILEEVHAGPYGAHFSGQRMFSILVSSWWWERMFSDASRFAKACPECAITTGVGRRIKPPLHPIAVTRPFQILGIDIMDLPLTDNGNRHVVVVQDLFTKWPFVFPVPDQKATRLAQLIAEEVVPWFGVPEALLSDRGANLLSHLVLDLCKLLGITKLNTSSYHPQCDGAVERMNRTLKQVLRRHVARFGRQWDRYLPGVLWAYRNTPHSSTGEKPSFLLFGVDLRTPTEAAYLPVPDTVPTTVEDYREELMVSLSSGRALATEAIQKSQAKYKKYYDRQSRETNLRVGDWILVYFPQEECGRNRKLSRPWHGPYRVLSKRDPNFTCGKVYFPQHGDLQVHQSRTCPCPPDFPAGYYWYGTKRKGPGRPPRWVDALLADGPGAPEDRGPTESHVNRSAEGTAQSADTSPHVPTPSRDDSVGSEEQLIHSMEATNSVNTPLESTDVVSSPMECVDADTIPWDDPALHSHDLEDTLPIPDKRPAPMPGSGLNQPPLQQEGTDEAAGRGGPSSIPQRPKTAPRQRDRRLRQVVRPPDRLP